MGGALTRRLGLGTVSIADYPDLVGGTTSYVNGSTGTNTTISLTGLVGGLAASPAAGDIVLVNYGIQDAVDRNPSVITSGYTEDADLHTVVTTGANMGVYHKIMGGTPDTSVVVGPTGQTNRDGVVAIQVFRGIDQVTPLDVAVVTGGTSGTKPNPGAITPATANSTIVVFAFCSRDNGYTTHDSLSDLTIRNDDGTAVIGHFNWTSGAYDPNPFTGGNVNSASGASNWCCMALRAA